MFSFFFFFNDTATTEIYTLSLHDALPIYGVVQGTGLQKRPVAMAECDIHLAEASAAYRSKAVSAVGISIFGDRKSTRLNSSHANISYAVFCLKKKKKIESRCTQPNHESGS